VSTFLADGNVLIALTVADHVHHETAVAWFEGTDASLATCPITFDRGLSALHGNAVHLLSPSP